MSRPTIVWFRQDLRLADNPALSAAGELGAPTIAVYINPRGSTAERPTGAAAAWWLHHSLSALSRDLGSLRVPLVLLSGDPREIVPRLVRETGADAVFWSRRYEAEAISIDRDVKASLSGSGVTVRSFNALLLHEPWQVTKPDGSPYKVFTPYWKAACAAGEPARPLPRPASFSECHNVPVSERLSDWHLTPTAPDWAKAFADHWQPGEAGARERLDAFLATGLTGYAEGRDRPDRHATSRLSPHLRFGEISPRHIWHAACAPTETDHGAVRKFLGELGWREFAYHLLYHWPDLATVNVQPKFDRFPWVEGGSALRAWQHGRTGYPIVDAGMRELWATGWMHNRVRMIAGSFLTKHLRIDWRRGEAWFWDTLVDADPANNPASWQWVAGSGADAAPYFRIFNPILQGEKFDPAGDYVRRWIPELGALPSRWIHKPWLAPKAILGDSGLELGTAYPNPIVEHGAARAAALDAYRTVTVDPAQDTGIRE